jgi:hypothetical protein
MFECIPSLLTAFDVAVTVSGAGFAIGGFFMGRFRYMGDSGLF